MPHAHLYRVKLILSRKRNLFEIHVHLPYKELCGEKLRKLLVIKQGMGQKKMELRDFAIGNDHERQLHHLI